MQVRLWALRWKTLALVPPSLPASRLNGRKARRPLRVNEGEGADEDRGGKRPSSPQR